VRVLILGGTSEARALAALLVGDFSVISSLAGRVADPALPVGEVRIGGFGGPDGLSEWLDSAAIDAVIDATHPFAASISRSAMIATGRIGLPLLGIRRPGWIEERGDDWHRMPSITDVAGWLGDASPRRVLLTSGRRDLAAFAELDQHWFLIRAVDPPAVALPSKAKVILARGPYTVAGELDLMRTNDIDVLVTKDSGGELTRAKLIAARELGIAVLMIDRPAYPVADTVTTVEAAAQWLAGLSS
jgi:precorrin-6A/cobalt-precorrin-6A reductase